MPFPTVTGVEAATDIETLLEYVNTAGAPSAVVGAINRLFNSVDKVPTQLYYDVRRLKELAVEHGWEIERDDPSQEPIK